MPITSAKYRAEMDIDRDGDVDSTDQTLRGTTFVAALPKGALCTPGPGSSGGVDSTVGWSGYRYDQATRLYAVRFRFYDAVTFRWLNRDPAGYVDSMNLYGYGFGSGIGWSDPFGLGGPFFAGGVTLDGEVITYDMIKMRGMGWEFRIYHSLLGFSDGWLDFFTFGGYTFARDALGWTPDWLQEESGWYRAGWWVGFGAAATLTVVWAWTRPAWHYTTAEGATAIARSGNIAATTRNLFGVRGVYGTIIPPALMARFPWLAILIGRTPAEVAWAVRLYGATPHWLIPWWRFVWGPVRLAGSGVAAAASVMATSNPFQPRNTPSSSIDGGGACFQ